MPPRIPMHQSPVVGIDLDDTLAEYNGWKGWRNIGEPRDFAQQFVSLFKQSNWIVFLYTARPEEGYLWEWLKHWNFSYENKLSVDYINKSPLNLKLHCGMAKPLADLYIDNATPPYCGDPVPLRPLARFLKERGVFDWGLRKKS
jgi:hypothetical protein